MNGELRQVNGNGQPMYLADAYFNPLTNQWSTPRAWSVSANQQAGYNVTGYQIRYENANNEKDLATLIKPVVDALVSANAFVLYPVQNKTPSYLSLFVCT